MLKRFAEVVSGPTENQRLPCSRQQGTGSLLFPGPQGSIASREGTIDHAPLEEPFRSGALSVPGPGPVGQLRVFFEASCHVIEPLEHGLVPDAPRVTRRGQDRCQQER
ncbi:MAG: hypothetical protein R3E12_04515 [Candidatus Eisenbacteria bacterium]